MPLDLHRQWMEHRHPDARVVARYDENPVDDADPAIWDAHVAIFRRLCEERVDAVFTSESYGDDLARRFEARHLVDAERRAFPVSGSAVRRDPADQQAPTAARRLTEISAASATSRSPA